MALIFSWIKKIFVTAAESAMPALFFAAGVFFYCDKALSFTAEPYWFNVSFYLLLTSLSVFLLVTKNLRDIFFTLIMFVVYLSLNTLKQRYGQGYEATPHYNLLCALFALNWLVCVFYFFFVNEKKYDFYLLCILLLEGFFIEHSQLFISKEFTSIYKISVMGVWLLLILLYMSYVSLFSGVKNYGLFFSFLACGLGIFNSESEFALSLYFLLATVIMFVSEIYTHLYRYFYDYLTGVYSKNTYLRHSKDFPLKYSLAMICIDDYAKLSKVFKKRQLENLIKMLANKIKESSMGADIYRYNDDEFVLIFNNEDKKTCFEYLENIRRSIAVSEFVLNSNHLVKLTISSGVSEKKRSDADAQAVLMRACEAVQRTYKFTQNMTSMG